MFVSKSKGSPLRLPVWSLALALAIGALAVLAGTRSVQQHGDSLVYALSVRTGLDLLHPHHLLFGPASRVVFLLLTSIDGSFDAVSAVQWHNILWSVVSLVALFALILRLLKRPALAFFGAVLLLSLHGFWHLSSQTTVYIPAAGSLILVSLIALWILERGPEAREFSSFLLGAVLALSILLYQGNVLFCIPLAVLLIGSDRARGAWLWLSVVVVGGLLTLSVYVAAFAASASDWSPGGFVRFCLTYASQICWGAECVDVPADWGSASHFSGQGLSEWLDSLLWNVVALPVWLQEAGALVLALALVFAVGWNARSIIRRERHAAFRAFLVTWAVSYGLWFLWWLPSYSHPLLMVAIPSVLLTLLMLTDIAERAFGNLRPRMAVGWLAIIVALLGSVNFHLSIRPAQIEESDALVEARELTQVAPKGAVFLVSYRVWNHLRYYFNREDTSRLVKYPLIYFYQDRPLPPVYRLDKLNPRIVDSSFVLPDYRLAGYSAQPVDGFTEPDRWLAYLGWLFDFEYDTAGNLTQARSFKVVRLIEGEPYLLILPSKAQVQGLPSFLRTLSLELRPRDSDGSDFDSRVKFGTASASYPGRDRAAGSQSAEALYAQAIVRR